MPQYTPFRDFSNGNPQDHIEFMVPLVHEHLLLDYLFHSCESDGDPLHGWAFDPIFGIEDIAMFSAQMHPSDAALMLEGARDAYHPNFKQARGYINAVEGAIRELISYGMIEIAVDDGWPVLRVTARAIESSTHLDVNDIPHLSKQFREMRERYQRLHTMPYREYLRTDEWKARRQLHLEHAGGRCQMCNSEDHDLHVHHRTYTNRGHERFNDLIALCPPCHSAFHRTGKVK